MSITNPVKTLNAEVARKIAAGEVIDRPNAILRELLDNSIDSGATSITVEITGGGIEKIRIIDNGCGMTKEDLQNCARPHATSKISTETDLLNLSTLGFRGEALASIAAVARLSIISGGWKMRASITEDHILEQVSQTEGTIVQSEGLFENFPARRQFLKRPATEGIMCRNIFIEKSMANPQIAFRFISEGEIKLDLPAGQTLKDRFVSANSLNENRNLFYNVISQSENKTDKPDWSFDIVIGEPAVSRTNKKDISIFTNGRKINEYSLVQAIEYGGQGFFPNGTYPVAAAFINVNPSQVDFNIHPAKREARFFDISDLHHGISSSIKNFFRNYTRNNFLEDKNTDDTRTSDLFESNDTLASDLTISNDTLASDLTISNDTPASDYSTHINYKSSETSSRNLSDFRSQYLGIKNPSTKTSSQSFSKNTYNSESLSKIHSSQTSTKSLADQALAIQDENYSDEDFVKKLEEKSKPKFIGCCLGTFLLAEKNDCLYMIDQHAAHERILFDKIMTSQGKRQSLLIPYKIRTESKSQDNQLEKLKYQLNQIGFETKKISDGNWEITSIPERWTGSEFDLRALLFVKQVEPKEIIRSIAAMTACKAAVKDGYVLDDITAARLVEQAFTLQDPHCPHGRPIYTVISRERLFQLVKRTF